MAFHYANKEEAKAALYDAAMVLLEADPHLGLPFRLTTVSDLSDLCHRIANGQPISKSPLLDY